MESEATLYYSLILESIAFLVALLFCALFSFLETSVTALRLFQLKELASTTDKYQSLFHTLENSPHQILITMLITNNLANVTAAALSTDIAEKIFHHLNLPDSMGFTLGIGVATAALLIFGEVIPKNVATIHGEKVFKSTLWIINLNYYLFYPIVTVLMKLSDLFLMLLGSSPESTELITSESEIRFLIDYIQEKGLIDPEKTEMLQSIFKLGGKQVKEIMIPAGNVSMLDVASSLQEATKIFSEHQFSRLPVYKDYRENVIGMIHQKDLFAAVFKHEQKTIQEILRPIKFVPETMLINQLLREFRLHGMHIALVLNEFGSITGLVTLEDVLEEIVGEISDEYEQITTKIVPLEEGGWLIDATTDLKTVSELLNIRFETDDVVTLGGFLTQKLQHVPQKGDELSYKGYLFHVQKAHTKRVLQILVSKESA
jgi:putative hemolysin